jgi:hypothetical protein
MRHAWLICVCVLTAGCWDFVEPDLAAENGAGALLLTASVDPSGNVQASATLSPGLDPDGFRRRVLVDTVRVLSFATGSDTVLPNGNHIYSLSEKTSPSAFERGFTVSGPVLEGVSFVPTARWYVPRKADPDTVRVARGSDLILHMVQDTVTSVPAANEQWLIELIGRSQRFQISATGKPPASLRIPAEWIPVPFDSAVSVSFSSFQNTQILAPDYRGFMSFSAFANWTVIVR